MFFLKKKKKKKKICKNFLFLGNGNVLMEKTKKKKNWQKFLIFRKRECAYDKVWNQGWIWGATMWKRSGSLKVRYLECAQTSAWIIRKFWYITMYDWMCFVGAISPQVWILVVFWPNCVVTFSSYHSTGEWKGHNVPFCFVPNHP